MNSTDPRKWWPLNNLKCCHFPQNWHINTEIPDTRFCFPSALLFQLPTYVHHKCFWQKRICSLLYLFTSALWNSSYLINERNRVELSWHPTLQVPEEHASAPINPQAEETWELLGSLPWPPLTYTCETVLRSSKMQVWVDLKKKNAAKRTVNISLLALPFGIDCGCKCFRAVTTGLWEQREGFHPENSAMLQAGSALFKDKHSPTLWC